MSDKFVLGPQCLADLRSVFQLIGEREKSPAAPSKRFSPSPQFLADLRQIAGQARRKADEFLPILARKFDEARKRRAAQHGTFLADLRKVYAQIRRTEPDLVALSKKLDDWRAEKRREMRHYLADLPDDDPLRCAISLYGAMDYGRLETAHTRTLTWLLDPKREHGFADRLITALLAELAEGWNEGTHEITRISSERIGYGRFDIVAEGTWMPVAQEPVKWLLVIEAKIDAWEGERQLARYDEWIEAHAGNRRALRVFLTPDARASATACEEWTALSFLRLACILRGAFKDLQDKPGYHFLRFYLTGVLKDICRWSIPVGDPDHCADPYGVVEYLKTVQATKKGNAHDAHW
jgi:PD-(D/E)XK nuclease superfamily protein